jgi:hypothetical protein
MNFEKYIKSELESAAEDRIPSDMCRARIDRMISEDEKGSSRKNNMRKSKLFKAAAITAACLALSGGGVYAAGKIIWTEEVTHSNPDYTSYEDVVKAEKETGLNIDVPERFENGYAFDSIHITDIRDSDEDGKVVNKRKGVTIKYTAGNPDAEISVNIDTDNQSTSEGVEEMPGTEVKDINGIKVYAMNYKLLMVPDDYSDEQVLEITDENAEIAGVGKGNGITDVSYKDVLTVWFVKDGQIYSIHPEWNQIFTYDDLFKMAEELISAK